MITHLNIWLRNAERSDLRRKRGQDGVDRRRDCATITGVEQKLGNESHHDDVALAPDLPKSRLQVGHLIAVNDLRGLHGWPRGHIQSGHVSTNIGIADDRKHTMRRHRDVPPSDDES